MKLSATSGATIAIAAASMILSGAVMTTTAQAAEKDIKCVGVNACKGQSACKTAASSCKGKNGCKGKGFMMLSDAACKAKGGKVG